MFYSTQARDRYQDHFIGLGALCGVSAAIVSYFFESNGTSFKDNIPISITIALTLSVISHKILPWIKASPTARQ